MKIAVGLSGGVDSSVAALLLKQQGYDVTGITMSIWNGSGAQELRKKSCYGPDEKYDIENAREVCCLLDIPFHVIDCSDQYSERVLKIFREEYLAARTPNPCIICNYKIKFGYLPEMAKSSGIEFDMFATGHYARVEYNAEKDRYLLEKGIDPKKDQSYFLYMLSQSQLRKTLFPTGTLTKDEVREIARLAGLPVWDREESQDFCSGDYRELLGAREYEGEIVHVDGRVLGKHKGLWNFTPGQRRGLSVSDSEPLYVVKLDNRLNRVIVGSKDDMYSSFTVRDINWIAVHRIAKIFKAGVKLSLIHI